jgi:hypothetical protein
VAVAAVARNLILPRGFCRSKEGKKEERKDGKLEEGRKGGELRRRKKEGGNVTVK